jgi:hypothetical protein
MHIMWLIAASTSEEPTAYMFSVKVHCVYCVNQGICERYSVQCYELCLSITDLKNVWPTEFLVDFISVDM